MFLGSLAVIAALVAGCSSDSDGGDTSGLPDGASLLKDAATATREIRSAHFAIKVNGTVSGIPVQEADGDLTRDGGPSGAAKGTIKLTLMGQLIDGEFVLVNDSLYIKGPTGGFQKYPASLTSNLYDPSAILNPDKGVANVLATVKDAKAEKKEDVGGVSTYRVRGKSGQDVISAIVPGVDADVSLVVWLREDTKVPVKASVEMPGADGKTATVELTLSDLGKQVTITAPA
jgi:lipoprotein LprG